ncbi:MAG: Flp pilus assembly complex ATPase component TadA [Oscillospiraceae bacterium]|jgi:type IV pilus assembly protein PilB|nr:Flp pilus assembly complex ATPase component TadA [Oscillospiraceae bacterium]
MAVATKKLRLGDILVHQGLITDVQLKTALSEQSKRKMRLGQCLVSLGYVTFAGIASAMHIQTGIPQVDLRGVRITQDILNLVPSSVLRKHGVLPIGFDEKDNTTLILAMWDPLDVGAQDDISIVTNYRVSPRIAVESEIQSLLDRYFGTDEAYSAAEQYSKERESQLQEVAKAAAEESDELNSAPMVQLVRSILEQAVRQRASDVHFDALETQLRVRYRIDGALYDKMWYDISLLPAIVTRIKILSGMDISEKRKPQDGRMSITVDRQDYDIRVSALPTFYGEKLVLRLASSNGLARKLTELGFPQQDLDVFQSILDNPNGIILVTGPTGSGKSTTLYASLSMLNKQDVNLITVEDPVEATVGGVNQVQVNVKADLTFANALRSILRQDPDVIMIGEIRDYETASIAAQASITGHLVLSTLHTNSSAATVTRLIDMGLEPFLLADALVGILAQRLVRKLCMQCREPHIATDYEKEQLGYPENERLTVYEPRGCPMCAETGYYGRIGVYEIMKVTPEIKRLIATRGTTEQIKDSAVRDGMNTLRMAASRYVIDGTTTIAEMLKISMET